MATREVGSGPFCVLQISDCHLAADPAQPYRGRNADAGLRSVLAGAKALAPDLILCTGDLSEDASPASYQRLVTALESIAAPVCALPGNHDDSDIMRRFFPAGPWQGPLHLSADVWRIVLLTSAVSGRIDGALDAADLLRLDELLNEQPDAPVLLALHHQPIAVGSPWIDRYPLQAPEALLDLVRRHRQVRGGTWGHIHHAFERQQGRVLWLGAPSTAANSLAGQVRFTLDPEGPACRWLKLYADGSMKTGTVKHGGQVSGAVRPARV